MPRHSSFLMPVLDLQHAITLLEEGDAGEAARLLEEMLEEMPAHATARVLLARAYAALGHWPRAADVWREALHLIPNSPVIRRGLERAAARSASRSPLGPPRTSLTRLDHAGTEPPPRAEPPSIIEPLPTPEPLSSLPSAEPLSSLPTPEPPRPAEPSPIPEQPYPEPERPRQFTYLEPESPDHPEPYEAEKHADHFWVPGRVEPEGKSAGRAEPEGWLPEEAEPEGRSPEEAEPEGWSPEKAQPDDRPAHQKRPEDGPHYEDLDRLISELESARIVPRPDIEEATAPELEDDIEDVVSETLARIYAAQGQYDEAARVYELLAGQHPEDADEFMKKASEMRARASDEM